MGLHYAHDILRTSRFIPTGYIPGIPGNEDPSGV